MVKFFSSDVLVLRKKYKEECDYTKVSILRELIATAFENGGSLPDRFDIRLKKVDAKSVSEVLKDIGFDLDSHDFYVGTETICVSSK